jgi:hypothetical protein
MAIGSTIAQSQWHMAEIGWTTAENQWQKAETG